MVNDVVARVVEEHPAWATANGSLNQCAIASRELIRALVERGVEAEALWVEGPLPTGESVLAPEAMVRQHMLVLVEGQVVDLTRRQWDVTAEHPTVYETLGSVGDHWSTHYAPGDDRDGGVVSFH